MIKILWFDLFFNTCTKLFKDNMNQMFIHRYHKTRICSWGFHKPLVTNPPTVKSAAAVVLLDESHDTKVQKSPSPCFNKTSWATRIDGSSQKRWRSIAPKAQPRVLAHICLIWNTFLLNKKGGKSLNDHSHKTNMMTIIHHPSSIILILIRHPFPSTGQPKRP